MKWNDSERNLELKIPTRSGSATRSGSNMKAASKRGARLLVIHAASFPFCTAYLGFAARVPFQEAPEYI